MQKKDFRKKCIESNALIQNKSLKSLSICDRIFPIVKNYEAVALYASIKDEVCLDLLIVKLLKHNIKVALPRVNGEYMQFYYIKSIDDLTVSNSIFGIREPNFKCQLALKEEIQAIIIPGIAFDNSKNRLGRGKGYYDKYLSDFKVVKIGVCFENQIADKIPIDKNDIPMDVIVTENKILY